MNRELSDPGYQLCQPIEKIVRLLLIAMVVRIRFGRGPAIGRKRGKNRRLAAASATLLTPFAVISGALALWRIAADVGWTSNFAFSAGILSHWQTWLAVALALQLCAHALNRYAKDVPKAQAAAAGQGGAVPEKTGLLS